MFLSVINNLTTRLWDRNRTYQAGLEPFTDHRLYCGLEPPSSEERTSRTYYLPLFQR